MLVKVQQQLHHLQRQHLTVPSLKQIRQLINVEDGAIALTHRMSKVKTEFDAGAFWYEELEAIDPHLFELLDGVIFAVIIIEVGANVIITVIFHP